MFFELISDLYAQISGLNGKAVLANGNEPLSFSRYADLITSCIPFEINRKPLQTKILSRLETASQDAEHFEQTVRLLTEFESYLDDLSLDFPCDLQYPKLSFVSLIRAVAPEVYDDSENLAEKLLNYMELVREFDRDKLFITVNLRSFINDELTQGLIDTVLTHEYQMIMIESVSYPILRGESRRTIDQDLCEF